MEYLSLWFIVGIIFSITLAAKQIKPWLKFVIFGYYLVLSYLFISRKEQIYSEYHRVPVPEQFWETNSDWVGFMLGFYFVPFLLILLFIYFWLFRNANSVKKRFFIALTIVPAAIIYQCLLFVFSMYGYRP